MRRSIRMIVVLVVVLGVLSTVSTALAAPQTTVSGTVGCSDGRAIPGATIVVSMKGRNGAYAPVATLAASTAGTWSYGGKAGDYRFVFGAQDADSQTRDLTMVNKGAYVLDVTLQGYGAIAGLAVDAATGLPLANATVELYKRDADGTWPTTAVTSVVTPDGSYAIPRLSTGVYAVCASAPGYGTTFHESAATIDSAYPLVVERGSALADANVALPALPMTGTISGHVYIGASRIADDRLRIVLPPER